MAISARLRFLLDSTPIPAPVEWEDIEILADFQNDSVQANITTGRFTFVNEARAQILDYIEGGKAGGFGIFEGIPFQIEAYNSVTERRIFDGFLDFTDYADFPDAGRIEIAIQQVASLAGLEKKLEGITYAFLVEQGIITDADYRDVRYVVVKPNQAQDIVIASIVLFLLVKELRQQIRELARDAATVAGYISGAITGTLGAIVFSVASLIFQIAYTAALAIAIGKIVATIVNAIYPIRRTHKAMTPLKLLEKACNYAGYQLETSVAELGEYVYLPSNLNVDRTGIDAVLQIPGRITQGIPNRNDFGYLVTEMLDLIKRTFKGKYAIVGQTVQFHWEGSPYWIRTASYKMPSVLIERKRFNTDEIKANTLIAFDTDLADEWTIADFTGTNYEAILTPIATRGSKEYNLITGLNQVRLPICLGSRKQRGTVLEGLIRVLNNFARSIAGVFGQRIVLQNLIETNGVLQVSNNNHSKPKLLYLDGPNMPANYRDKLSAKYLYQNFHYYDSFGPPFAGQKAIFEDVTVPFGLSDFLKIVENSYFSDAEGDTCKAVSVRWRLGADKATFNYWKREVYTRNIQITEIEP